MNTKQHSLQRAGNNSSNRLGIGIDYGTSNSAAAIFDGTHVTVINLEPRAKVMPSATYINREYQIVTGQAAIDEYVSSNTGRTVELSAEILGEGRTTTGQTGDHGLPEEASTSLIYGQSLVDGGQQGRLFRGIKRLLGNNESQRLMVFDKPFRLVALITPLLIRIRRTIEAQLPLGLHPTPLVDHACIGHPVNFEGSQNDRNRAALSALSESYGYAEFNRQSFYPEPNAAALSYLHANPQLQTKTLLAVDFGGGTLDLCVIKHTNEDFEVVATHGIGLGGDHIDQLLFRELIFPLLEYEDLLLNWAVSYMLNQNKYTTPLHQRIQDGDDASTKFQRLYDLIKNNHSYLVFQLLKDLKAELSHSESARLDIPELDIELTLTRAQFETMISSLMAKFEQAIDDTLMRAAIQNSDIELVIRTGGSSLIPAVKRVLEQRFPSKVVEHDPFTSVAAGLAIAEYLGVSHSESQT